MVSITVNELTKNSPSVEHMIPIMHNNVPVITTELLADVYETDVINIQVNHSRNKERFIEGKHYFKLTGSILKELKNRLTQSKSVNNRVSSSYSVVDESKIVGKRARSLILWTERGAARHAKMLDTDKAWDVFGKLEDFYFNLKGVETVAIKSTVQQRNPLKNAVNLLVSKKSIMYPEAYSLIHQRFNVESIDELTVEQLPLAVEYVHKLALEGEYIPKESSLLNTSSLPDNGKILVTLRNREIQDYQTVDPNSHVLTLNTFMELAQRAGYLIIHKESFSQLVNKW
ncbi:ORF6N domain-containing protein [Xenorhabdus bharatensis]|uniref:ORF6N domain-containing protein n=1 Tax=Xenorhabdus bharatensis TaxID=3136256 RepID=UPI003BF461EA